MENLSDDQIRRLRERAYDPSEKTTSSLFSMLKFLLHFKRDRKGTQRNVGEKDNLNGDSSKIPLK
ncbi:MAG: hypothetical protein ACRBG0_13700 [Lewinella sp.]|jgi:hypothetical protein|uniref:hypothetical protein n=1 Tax=Lewinella sp. TaxID=2004506 RepID=UPI003D6AAAB1